MIFVDRNQPVNGVIVRPNQRWFDDADALTAQAKQDGPSHKVTDHYKECRSEESSGKAVQ